MPRLRKLDNYIIKNIKFKYKQIFIIIIIKRDYLWRQASRNGKEMFRMWKII